MSVVVDGSNGLIFNDASTQTTAATGFGFKNRIINGDMRIDQRNAGASVTPSNGYTTIDRWSYWGSQSSKFTLQQTPSATETGYATRLNAGFTSYLASTVASAVSIGASDYFFIQQSIEGYNSSDLALGTSSAKTFTLSFWVYSSLTGTFGGSFQNAAQNRSYPFSYTISAANTWEQKTVTVAGDTSGTWVGATNGTGLIVNFSLGMGSTRSSTAGSWQSGNYFSATGATSVVGTGSATFYVTGVQIEKGSTATSFDYRDYGRELIMCQRYYAKIGLTSGEALGSGMTQDSYTAGYFCVKYPVTMRSAATLAYNYIGVSDAANGTALVTSIRGQSSGTTGSNFGVNWSNPGWTVFYRPMVLIAADSTGYISMSAEL